MRYAILCLVLFTANAEGQFSFVDLQAYANIKLVDNQGRGIEGNTLDSLPRGEQVLGDTTFKVGDGLIQLGSKLLDRFPDKVEGIKVGMTIGKLHFLHASAFGGGPNAEGTFGFVNDGTRIGEYRVNFEDGSSETIPIVYGVDVRDWFYRDDEKEPSAGKVVWKGENARATAVGVKIRLYASEWKNPKPAVKVVSVDFLGKKEGAPASPFCIAMTVEGTRKSAVGNHPKWEYKVVSYRELLTMMGAKQKVNITPALNELGDEGWELVSVEGAHDQLHLRDYHFKRPKIAAPAPK